MLIVLITAPWSQSTAFDEATWSRLDDILSGPKHPSLNVVYLEGKSLPPGYEGRASKSFLPKTEQKCQHCLVHFGSLGSPFYLFINDLWNAKLSLRPQNCFDS